MRRLDDRAAVVEAPDGGTAVALSSVPLWTRSTGNDQAAVDLELRQRDNAFAPANPLVPLRISSVLQGGVQVGPIGFTPLSSNASVTGVAIEDKAFFANTQTDTDFMVAALPVGAQAFWVLRSRNSPEQLGLELSLPRDATLEADPDAAGGAVVKRGDLVISRIAPPVAGDADGVSVPASYRIDGTRLRVNVAHREGEFRYPITVDPAFAVSYGNGPIGDTNTFAGWVPDTNCGIVRFSTTAQVPQSVMIQKGWIPATCYGRWTYTAPGSAYVFEADYANLNHYGGGGNAAWYGLTDAAGSAYSGGGVYYDGYQSYTVASSAHVENAIVLGAARRACTTRAYTAGQICTSTEGTPGNKVFFSLYELSTQVYGADQFAYVYQTTIFLADKAAPAAPTISGIPSGWSETAPATFRVQGSQGGIGINAFGVKSAGAGYPSRYVFATACNRAYIPPYAPCPQNAVAGASIDVPINGTVPEGINAIDVDATTPIMGGPTATAALKIDRTGPEIQLGGALASASAAEAHQQVSNVLDLDITATDGSSAGGPIAIRSGVATVSVFFDGSQIDSQASDATCIDSCAVTIPTIEADADQLSEGDHTLKVTATDRMGHRTEKTWTVPIIRNDYFTAKLAAWRATVEAKVDAVVPAVPLTGGMPALPDKYSSASAQGCVTDTPTMEACDAQIKAWGADVRAWLTTNVAVLAQALDTLPDMPGYVYAEDDYARRYVAAAQEEFQLAKKLSVNPAQVVDVRLNLKTPVDLTTLTTALGSLTGLQGPVAFRGVLSKDEQPIVAEQESNATDSVATQADQFYSTLLEDIDEDIADFTAIETDPAFDPDDQTAAAAERAQLQQIRSTVVTRGPLISNVGIRLPLLSVLTARLSGILDVTSVDLPIVGASTSDILQPGTEQMTASEYIANHLPGEPPTTGAGLRAAGDHRGQTCADRSEYTNASPVARRTTPIPGDFMPSQHLLDSFIVPGTFHKGHTLRWMWAAPKSLQWFCARAEGQGYEEGRRGFEEEVRVPIRASTSWSTNWYKSPGGYSYKRSNLPGAVLDDLACGREGDCPGNNPYEAQKHPDFSMTSNMASEFRYGKWYYTKFRTNDGDTHAPSDVAVYTATATKRAPTTTLSGFCTSSKLLKRPNAEPASCMFTAASPTCLSPGRQIGDGRLRIVHNFRADSTFCDVDLAP